MPPRSARHVLAIIVGVATFSTVSVASAETVEREILGWTTTGSELVVKLTQRGERMVDGVAADYYFEATEIWSANDGSFVQRYKRGEAVGSPPSIWAEAKDASLADSYLETVGLREAIHNAASPAGTHRIASFGTQKVQSPRDGVFRCETTDRISMFDAPQRRVYTVANINQNGEESPRADEAACPAFELHTAWAPGADRWAAFAVADGKPQLVVGDVNKLTTFAHADFLVPTPPVVARSPEGRRSGWQALATGDLDEAATAFAESPQHLALVAAWTEKSRVATRAADKAFRSSDKTPLAKVLRAAAHLVADSTKQAPGWIDEAVQGAGSYEELMHFAAIFSLVDPAIANQLAVHALSHPSAEGKPLPDVWAFLAHGLIDVGEYSKAEEALDKVESSTPRLHVERARLHLDRQNSDRARQVINDLLFSNPGRCESYLLAARWHGQQGSNAAARDFFDTAVHCDEHLAEAQFYAADYARLAGDLTGASTGFAQFLATTLPRRSDPILALRRTAAKRWVERLRHEGIVLADASCQRTGDAFLCRGTVFNTTDAPIENVAIEVQAKHGSNRDKLPSVAPATATPFGVRLEAKSLEDALVTVGRDKKERDLNAIPVR